MTTSTTIDSGLRWNAPSNRDPLEDIRRATENSRRMSERYWSDPDTFVLSPTQVRHIRRLVQRWGHVPITTRWRIMKECDAILKEVGLEP